MQKSTTISQMMSKVSSHAIQILCMPNPRDEHGDVAPA